MALIVGDDFQHILRVLNTNVDGREKVGRRFRFLLVREWVFGERVRMRSSSTSDGEAKPFWDHRLSGRIASRDEWERWNATRARDGSWRGGHICARECVLFEPFGCSRHARSGAKSDVIVSFLKMCRTKGSKRGERPHAHFVFLEQNFLFTHHATNAISFLVTQQVMYSLTKIKGIGRRFANIICKKAEIDMGKRAGELSAAELESLMVIVSNPRQFRVPDWFLNRKKDVKDGKYTQLTSNQLDTKLRDDIERLKKMRNHRGLRHYWGIKVRGQHTKTTGRRGKLGR